MSDARADAVRRACDALGRRDLRAVLDELDPDVEVSPLVSVWQRSYRGHTGVEQWWRDVSELWEEFSIRPDDFRDLGDDVLLVRAHWHGRGKGNATGIDGPTALVIRFRNQKATSVDGYLDDAHAMRAVEQRG